MSNTLKTAAGAAVLSIGLAFSAQAERIDNTGPFTCDGMPFTGEYLVAQHPSFAPLTPETFNLHAGSNIVADVKPGGFGVVVTPVNKGQDCKDFMDTLEQNPVVRSVDPNWILGIGGPGPDFF